MAYIPTKDSDLISWGRNFTTLLTLDPGRYGLQPADAALLQTEFDSLSEAYQIAINPATRTSVSVAHKDGQKALFLTDARAYAAVIRANRGVTADDKLALGLNIPDPTPTPIPVPSSAPVLVISLAAVGVHQLVISDELTPTKRAKPQGVAGMLLYRKTGAVAPTSPEAAELVQLCTTSMQLVLTAGLTQGYWAAYWGRWYNRKGELGPMSGSTPMIIA